MNDFTQTLQDLPVTGLIPVVLLIGLGLGLWAAGRKILRVAFAALGLIVGGCAGWLMGDAMNLGVWTWGTAAIGACVLACVSLLAFRMAVAVAMAVIFAIAAPLGVIAVAEIQAKRAGTTLAEAEVRNPVTDEITNWMEKHDDPQARQQVGDALKSASESARQGIDRAKAALSESLEGKTDAHIEQIERFSVRIRDAIRAKWDSTPPSLRPTLTVSMIAGGLLGLILGGLVHTLSAAAITALGGSLLWLCGLQVLAVRLGADGPWMPTSGTTWLALWLITSAAGVVIQWTFRKRKADKPSA